VWRSSAGYGCGCGVFGGQISNMCQESALRGCLSTDEAVV